MSRLTLLLVATTLMPQGAVAYKLLSITPPETVAVPRIHAVDAVIDISGMPAQGCDGCAAGVD